MICVQARIVVEQVFLTPTHLAIAMEYAQGGDLFNYTLGHRPHGRLAEQQARWIFQQLIIGLDYCHRRVSVAPGSPVHDSSACTTRAVMRNAEGRPILSKSSPRAQAAMLSRHLDVLRQSAAGRSIAGAVHLKGTVDAKPVHRLWAVQAPIRAATSLPSSLAVSEASSCHPIP